MLLRGPRLRAKAEIPVSNCSTVCDSTLHKGFTGTYSSPSRRGITVSGYANAMASAAKLASKQLVTASGATRSNWLTLVAEALGQHAPSLIEANQLDLARAAEFDLSDAMVDRLRLSDQRLAGIANAVEGIRALPDPVGEIIDGSVRPNGLQVTRVRVPLGVVLFIYESRPNVTIDAAALCVKSGNAVILRGGKEAANTNAAFHRLLVDTLDAAGLPTSAVQFVDNPDRSLVGDFLALGDLIDVTIPRGGRTLIERVSNEARMPVIRHFDGICHVYVDQYANLDQAVPIIVNAKCQRPGVCNAAESLLVHAEVADVAVPAIAKELLAAGVELRGCERCRRLVPDCEPATEEDYGTEYLSLTLSVRVVDSLDEAIHHIDTYGSGHTEAILTNDVATAQQFTTRVDASAVIVNASTRFNDGGELGLGAEIGISTDKFHARGPCGLRELTSYKYIVTGSGQTR